MPSRLPACAAPILLFACASSPAKDTSEVAVVRHVDHGVSASATVPLAGSRCQGRRSCVCRAGGGSDDAEAAPPAAGFKRFELRVAADGGNAALEAPDLGHFEAAGPQEACFYIDVPAGKTTDVSFVAHARAPQAGVSPRLKIAE